jgi:hypothetical protein
LAGRDGVSVDQPLTFGELAASTAPLFAIIWTPAPRLHDLPIVNFDEKQVFALIANQDATATEKLAEGIRCVLAARRRKAGCTDAGRYDFPGPHSMARRWSFHVIGPPALAITDRKALKPGERHSICQGLRFRATPIDLWSSARLMFSLICLKPD